MIEIDPDMGVSALSTGIYVYDEAQRAVVATANMTRASSDPHLAVVNGNLLAVLLQMPTIVPSIDLFDIAFAGGTVSTLKWQRTVKLRVKRTGVTLTALGPYVYVIGGTTPRGDSYTGLEILDTRDGSVFTAAESLTNENNNMIHNLLVGSTPNAIYVTGYTDNAPWVDVFSCGNSQVDPGEACDVHIPHCSQDCTRVVR